ncbi:MAG: Gfo/Idh/MocA family oxidoreductase [Catenulispora sp.]|nr:Gfo/Idh/MocA family oxidoreductase [Catenulispora sp.]
MPGAHLGHAIIGCGRVAPNHADGISALKGAATLLWACDRDLAKAQAFAAAFDIPRATRQVQDVLSDPEVASVSIATDHAQHAELVEAAILAGKHVLVEKPLALDPSAARGLASLAETRGLVLSVVSQHLYDPLVNAVQQWKNDGLLGRLLSAQISLQARREPDYYSDSYWRGTLAGEGGSALINQGYHCLDVARLLCGDLSVRAATAHSEVLGDVIETEDTLSALLLAGASPVSFHVTVASTTLWSTRIELVGDRGSVVFDLDHPATLHHAHGNRELEEQARALNLKTEKTPGVDYYGTSHRRQIADFISAASTGRPLMIPPQWGVAAVALIHEIYEAALRDSVTVSEPRSDLRREHANHRV